MTIIGCVNRKTKDYFSLLENTNDYSITLGDFGMKRQYDAFIDFPVDVMRHQILMGCDDFYPYLYHPFSLGDYGFFEMEGIEYGFIRGGTSSNDLYDYDARTWNDGMDWEEISNLSFKQNETLSVREYEDMADAVTHRRPKIMLSYDVPYLIGNEMFGDTPTKSNIGLQYIFESHQPDMWIFSGKKISQEAIFAGSRFVSLAPLEMLNMLNT